MTTFVKEDYEGRKVGHDVNEHDDALMASLISLYCAHELDCDSSTNYIPSPSTYGSAAQDHKDWICTCVSCLAEFESTGPGEYYRCPARSPDGTIECGSVRLNWKRKVEQLPEHRNVGLTLDKLEGKGKNEAEALADSENELSVGYL